MFKPVMRLSHGCGSTPMCTSISVYIREGWDVHWGYDLDFEKPMAIHGHILTEAKGKARPKEGLPPRGADGRRPLPGRTLSATATSARAEEVKSA